MSEARRLATWTLMAILGLTGATSGCASGTPAVRMVSSADVPAATGTLKASLTDHGNTALEVEVHHLARPELVHPGATTYVVWARAPGGAPQNLGALRVDEDLRGKLKTITPLRRFDVFITAEPSPIAMRPSSRRLLSASIMPARG